MKTIGSFYAKTHLSQLLDEVYKGEKIIITKHGKSIAVLSPVEEHSTIKIKSTLERLQKLHKKIKKKMTFSEIMQIKEKGRK